MKKRVTLSVGLKSIAKSETEQYLFWREKHKELAKKGWLYPTFPKEYGGGGLTGDHETIIEEEFHKAGALRGLTNGVVYPALFVWATEEQKQKFLVPLVTGEKIAWQKFTEPHSGADLADYQSKAAQDGDDWILNGSSVYVSGRPRPEWNVPGPDYLFGPMLTDPEAPRHRNMGYFMIPNPSPGLTLTSLNLIHGSRQKIVTMDNVRVPADHLIGGDHEGWQVMGTHLEAEHGGHGAAAPRAEEVENMVDYLKETKYNNGTLGKDLVTQQVAMEAVLEAHVQSLLIQRTYWMYQSHRPIQYEGNLSNVHGRESGLRNAQRVREVYGMPGFLGVNEGTAPHGGAQEVSQRNAAGQRHAGGSTNIAKVILARRIGISRTQERAATTPSTAASLKS